MNPTKYQGKIPKSLLTVSGFLAISLLGVVDYYSGAELSFSIFYLIPISLITWLSARWIGSVASIASAAAWLVADLLSGHSYSPPAIPYWNAAMRLGLFLIVVFLLSALKSLNQELEEKIEKRTRTLQESEKHFRALIEKSQDAIALIDARGIILYESPSVSRILGYSGQGLVGQSFFEYIHPDDQPNATHLFSQLLQQPGASITAQVRFRRQDGAWRGLDASATNLLAEPGVEAIVANYRDITERKEAENEIQRLASFPRLNPNPVLEADFTGRIIYANEAAYATLASMGLTDPHAFLPTELVELLSREPPNQANVYQREIAIADRIFDETISTVPVLETMRIYIHDITERKEAREALKLFRTLIDQSNDAIEVIDPETGRFLDVNGKGCQDLGYSREEFLSLSVFDIDPMVDQSVFTRIVEELQKSDALLWEGIHRRKDGSEFPVEVSLGYVNHGHGYLISVARDITGRIRDQEKIIRQLNQLTALRKIDQAIADNMDLNYVFNVILEQVLPQLGMDATNILLFDPISQTLKFGAGSGFRTKALQHTQLPLGEGYAGRVALGRQMIHITNLQGRNTDFLRSPSFSQEGFVSYFCLPLIAKDEIKGVLEVFLRTPFEADTEWLNFLDTLARQAAIAIDSATLFTNLQQSNIELERRVEERTLELMHANRAKDEFLATMSHELRTPLNSILGFSESLLEQRRGPLNEKQEQYVQLISSSGSHLLVLINDILEVSKIEAGKLDIHPEIISVKELCESSLAFVKELAARKSISVEFKNDASISTLRADPQRLKQILVNLLNNAVKFTPEKGMVSLEVLTNAERNQIHFSVTDDGSGIAQDDLKKLFTPFSQLDSSLSRQHDGTGLGLVIVLKLTELHGGSVQVESKVGVGSRFTIVLPWSEHETKDQQEDLKSSVPVKAVDKPASISGEHMTILLAEDTESNVMTIRDYLTDHGYQVAVAHNGLEAIAIAEKLSPDIILMDIQMPELDGMEAIRRLRKNPHFATTPIIALTALAMSGDRERCLEAGASEYMSKPVGLKMLVKTIRKLLSPDK